MRTRLVVLALPLLWAFAAENEAPSPTPTETEPAEDPCAHLREAIEKREDYLRRLAAERDTFGWVEDSEDAQALRLLQGLRRCAEFPDDEDCKPPPIEMRLEDLEPPRHTYERRPGDLDAGEKLPDDVPHDPKVLDLMQKLRACELARSPQPLLERERGGARNFP